MPPQRSTPKERVETARRRWGDRKVVSLCVEAMDSDPRFAVTGELLDFAMVLGELADPGWVAGGKPPGHRYWPRVWAARALLYVWDDSAATGVVDALDDEHWRVREMAAKVIVRRELPDAGDRLAAMTTDEVPRVRAAACRALAVVGEGEHADALVEAGADGDPLVSRAAERALEAFSVRLDRQF